MPAETTFRHHLIKNTSLLLLSLLFLPINTLILTTCLLYRRLHPSAPSPAPNRKTILISGLAMAKGLHLARTFHATGHRVIGVDFTHTQFGHSRVPSSGRFSRALDAHYTVSATHYIPDMLAIILRERVDAFFCVSGVATTLEDALLKAFLNKSGCACKILQLHPETAELLHDKHSFIAAVGAAGLPAPVTKMVTTHEEALRAVATHATGKRRFIMKSVWLDDVSRGDMTLLPRPTQAETFEFIHAKEMGEEKPWVLQEYVAGNEEYATHAVIVEGVVTAFAVCRSSDMLMRYRALPAGDPLALRMLDFTRKLVGSLEEGKLTGQVSVDFLVERDEAGAVQRMLPIESNPRAHTAVVLFAKQPGALTESYLRLLEKKKKGAEEEVKNDESLECVVCPEDTKTTYCWMGHELVVEVLLPMVEVWRGEMTVREWVQRMVKYVGGMVNLRDATFEVLDPIPWFWMYHVYYPWFFVLSLVLGKRWTRINVSTTRVFESS